MLNDLVKVFLKGVVEILAATSFGVWVGIFVVLVVIGFALAYVHAHYGKDEFEFGTHQWYHPALPRRRHRHHRHHHHRHHRPKGAQG